MSRPITISGGGHVSVALAVTVTAGGEPVEIEATLRLTPNQAREIALELVAAAYAVGEGEEEGDP